MLQLAASLNGSRIARHAIPSRLASALSSLRIDRACQSGIGSSLTISTRTTRKRTVVCGSIVSLSVAVFIRLTSMRLAPSDAAPQPDVKFSSYGVSPLLEIKKWSRADRFGKKTTDACAGIYPGSADCRVESQAVSGKGVKAAADDEAEASFGRRIYVDPMTRARTRLILC